MSSFFKAKNHSSRRKRSVNVERHIEALLVADHTLVDHFNRINQNLEYFLFTIMNMVTFFQRNFVLITRIKPISNGFLGDLSDLLLSIEKIITITTTYLLIPYEVTANKLLQPILRV